MGNKPSQSKSKNKETKIEEKVVKDKDQEDAERLEFLQESFKNTGVYFSEKELLSLKLKVTDAEQYFGTKFDYFICFNSYLFQERVHQIYDNYNIKIESCKKNRIKVLVEFDNEMESGNTKIDFDSLLTVILEKLEIETYIYFDLTGTDVTYCNNFFEQLSESVEMYRYNRKYENLFFLLPNTDYLLKYEAILAYCSYKDYGLKAVFNNLLLSQSDKNKLNIKPKSEKDPKPKYEYDKITIWSQSNKSEANIQSNYETNIAPIIMKPEQTSQGCSADLPLELVDIRNKFIEKLFTKFPKDKLLSCRYPRQYPTQQRKTSTFEQFINYNKPTYIKLSCKFNLSFTINKSMIDKKHGMNKSLNKNAIGNIFSTKNISRLNNDQSSMSSRFLNLSQISTSVATPEISKDAVKNIIWEANQDTLSSVKMIAQTVPYITLLLDNFLEVDCLRDKCGILALITQILDIANDTDLNDTYFSIKLIVSYKTPTDSKNDKYMILSDIVDQTKRYMNTLNKKNNRVIAIELVEISPIDNSDSSGGNNTSLSSLVYDQLVVKWKNKKEFNPTYLLALLAKKSGNIGLLEEEVIQRINSFTSLLTKSTSTHSEGIFNESDCVKLTY